MASNFTAGPSANSKQGNRPGTSRASESTVLLFRNSKSFTNNNAAGSDSGYSSSSESDSEGNMSMSRIASGTLCTSSDANNNPRSTGGRGTSSASCDTIGFPLGSTPATTALLVPSKHPLPIPKPD